MTNIIWNCIRRSRYRCSVGSKSRINYTDTSIHSIQVTAAAARRSCVLSHVYIIINLVVHKIYYYYIYICKCKILYNNVRRICVYRYIHLPRRPCGTRVWNRITYYGNITHTSDTKRTRTNLCSVVYIGGDWNYDRYNVVYNV